MNILILEQFIANHSDSHLIVRVLIKSAFFGFSWSNVTILSYYFVCLFCFMLLKTKYLWALDNWTKGGIWRFLRNMMKWKGYINYMLVVFKNFFPYYFCNHCEYMGNSNFCWPLWNVKCVGYTHVRSGKGSKWILIKKQYKKQTADLTSVHCF